MAMNPMQRRARTSFIIGFLVALIIGSLVVVGLLFKIKSINEAKEAIEALQKKVYVATTDLESGQEVTLADFTMGTVQTTVPSDTMIIADDFEFKDKNGDIITRFDDEGNQIEKKMVVKINVPAGTIITKDMLEESDDLLDATQRIQEFNMILLPSQLKNGDYIDVRVTYPNGQDFIVLSKKKVIGTNATSVWLKLDELEINIMNNAIVEAYKATGTKLYAIEYIEPGMQKEATPTYVVSQDIMYLINKDPNIITEAKNAYATQVNDLAEFRANTIETVLDANRENGDALVSAGNSNEQQKVQALRQEFVKNLEGTEEIGYNE